MNRSTESTGQPPYRVLFVQDYRHAPEFVSGVVRNTQALSRRLKARGIASAVLACLSPHGRASSVKRLARRVFPQADTWPDPFAGHPTYRVWNVLDAVPSIIKAFRPTVAVMQWGESYAVARAFLELGVPVVAYHHSCDFRPPARAHDPHELLSTMACSQFVADCLLAEQGFKATVVRPLVEPAEYRVSSTREEVLFVNPRAEKGVDIAWALAAARQDIPFRFVEAWHVTPEEHAENAAQAQRLGNVSMSPSGLDMRTFYARTRLLLAPSVWAEGFGRVVAEAQVSGIPALTSDSGGLPDAMGPGGVQLPLGSPIEDWTAALSRLWDDHGFYQAKADAALAHGRRADFTPEGIVDLFVAHLDAHRGGVGAERFRAS